MSDTKKDSTTKEHQSSAVVTSLAGKNKINLLVAVVIVVLVSGLSFVGGMQYQKGKQTDDRSPANGEFGRNGSSDNQPGSHMRIPDIGKVTAIDSTSITVDMTRGETTTLGITSDTKVLSNGTVIAISDVKVGDKVLVQTSPSDPTTITRILLNPQGGNRRAPQTAN